MKTKSLALLGVIVLATVLVSGCIGQQVTPATGGAIATQSDLNSISGALNDTTAVATDLNDTSLDNLDITF